MYSNKAPDSLFPQTMLCMATQINSLGHTDKARKNWTQILFKLGDDGSELENVFPEPQCDFHAVPKCFKDRRI